MTSLPITIPSGYSLLVKKGDFVKAGQVLAQKEEASSSFSPVSSSQEIVIDLASVSNLSPSAVRKKLLKGPGDTVAVGEVLLTTGTAFGLKKEEIISEIDGTVSRFERDTGRLILRNNENDMAESEVSPQLQTIISPLVGTISLCNNDAIVIETESKTLMGSEGIGGTAKGKVVAINPKGDIVTSDEITKEYSGKVVILPDIQREALAKAAVLEVGGILGTALHEGVFGYISSRKIDLPVIAIDTTIGKKLMKEKNDVIIHGEQKTIVLEE